MSDAPASSQAEEPGDGAAHEIYLAGTGSFAVEVSEWAQDAGLNVLGLIELLDRARVGGVVAGHPVLAPDSPDCDARVVMAIGTNRSEHWSRLAGRGWRAGTLLHPRAHLSASVRIGAGCVVAPGAVVGAATVIGEHALLSRGALVGHHVRIGSFVSLQPGANVGGHAELGDGATLGMGAVIVNRTKVGRHAIVAAGAVVIGEVDDRRRVQGVPAKEYRG